MGLPIVVFYGSRIGGGMRNGYVHGCVYTFLVEGCGLVGF